MDFVLNLDRRKFITAFLPVCGLSCLSLNNLLAIGDTKMLDSKNPQIHKFQKDFCQTYEEAFNWRFGYFIEYMERFAEYLGRGRLIEMIKRAVDDSNPPAQSANPDFSFSKWIKGGKDTYANMMTWEIIEESENVYEMRVSECLWWKIFKKHNATDIGYASVCYTDFSYARMFHPKLRLERTKTLMEGHDCCNHRWIFEG